jgi:hypothetical protein
MAVTWVDAVNYACVAVCACLPGIPRNTCKILMFWKFAKFLLYFKLEFVPPTLIIANH